MSQPPPVKGGVPASILLYALVLVPVTAFAGWVITVGHDQEATEAKLREKYGPEIRSVEQKRRAMSDLYLAAIKNPGSNPQQEARLQQVLRGGRGDRKRNYDVDDKYYGTELGLQARQEYLQQVQPVREEEARQLKKKLRQLKKRQHQQEQQQALDGESSSDDDERDQPAQASKTKGIPQKTTLPTSNDTIAVAGAALVADTAASIAAEANVKAKGHQVFTRKKKRKLPVDENMEAVPQSTSFSSSQVMTMAAVATVAAVAGYLAGGGRSGRS